MSNEGEGHADYDALNALMRRPVDDLSAIKHATRRMLRALDGSNSICFLGELGWNDVPKANRRYHAWVETYEKYRAQVEKMLEEDGRA